MYRRVSSNDDKRVAVSAVGIDTNGNPVNMLGWCAYVTQMILTAALVVFGIWMIVVLGETKMLVEETKMLVTPMPVVSVVHVATDMTTCPHLNRVALDASTSGVPHMLGAVGVPQLRLLSELHTCTGATTSTRPNPRHISNVLFTQPSDTPKSTLKGLTWSFGQYIDHEIVLTRVRSPTSACPAMNINTIGDPSFGTRGPIVVMPSVLTLDSATGTYHTIAGITNFIDGSAIYGSDAGRSYHLRAFAAGELRVGHLVPDSPLDETLPNNTFGIENVGGDENPHMFLAGDIRSSEQAPLSAWHTLWMREHNYQARRLAASLPGATDECLFQAARAIVVGELQRAVFDEFVPALLGSNLTTYVNYQSHVDPRISVEFSGAAYRFGHSMVNDIISRANPTTGAELDSLPLRHAFKRPDALLREVGIDEFFAGAATTFAEQADARVVDALRQHLFEDEGAPLDLVAINIERGRELNLTDFATLRAHFATQSWPSFTTRVANDATLLTSLYGGGELDLYLGLLVEAPARDDAVLGRTLEAVVRDQFTRLRDGDPQYYRALTDGVVTAYVDSDEGTLRSIITRNTGVSASLLSANVFK